VSYRALYRVWRPQRFAELVGQEHVRQTLTNALQTGRLSHAYLFDGPRGTGKTSAAKLLAKAVNCKEAPTPEPCNACEICQRITAGAMMDVIEIDAASNRGVDEIRDLRDKVRYAPTEAGYKIYIIDEVHMLTTEAFNALLKTLEEPPAHVIFILATTEPHKLPLTIISRCQRFTFHRISHAQLVSRLKLICASHQVEVDESALSAVARAADGGMRDALSLLDQALAFGGQRLDEQVVLAITGCVSKQAIFAIMQAVVNETPHIALDHLDKVVMGGLEPEMMMQDLTFACRDLLLWKVMPQQKETQYRLLSDEAGKELADRCSVAQLTNMLDSLVHYQQQMKWVATPRILLEMAIVRLCQPHSFASAQEIPEVVQALQERVHFLEQQMAQVKQPLPVTVSAQIPSIPEASPEPRQMIAKTLPANGLDPLSPDDLLKIKEVWPQILHQVKEKKVMVHAWLIDGEPVGATSDKIVLAFKSNIHRQTMERAANKLTVEQVIEQVLGSPKVLKMMMASDWEEMRTQRNQTPSSSVTEASSQPVAEEIVQKAVQLFGEKVVEMIDSA
jgi:DNA polymerase III subunit gamma/tau